MKSLVAILIGFSLTFGIFGSAIPSTSATLHGAMSVTEHASMSADCSSGVCTTLPALPANCSALCFIASGFEIDTGILQGSITTLLVLALAAILALRFGTTNNSLLAFERVAHRDPRLILTTHKRE